MAQAKKRGVSMQRESIRFKRRSQVTIPKEFVDALNLHEGDRLECRLENGRIVIVPTVEIPKDQAWFWTEEWQEEEREAEEDIKAGRVKTFDNVDDLIADLESDETSDGDER
ncbi:AbrB/MazE/SpoVT family DNA-binding domain-containing protein [Natribacillus halophilus]|uniref:Looped-hinge helix DNA binding domain-containing protein, AbrB family n=1 Tax=Natribacillus halophilus TaxID=549003 RepID=A0A1G8RKK8_9BACI|nr:AbrB/MazE/SpoVT family DNA-binding domain-containing protein [Natribacillus halophilus]SDJ16900.1 looped-hinge helix DNA binding domain-containing protein, AbrB family [Natribacillus halophilus]